MRTTTLKILVVDDEEGITALLSETLRLAGFDPVVSTTGPDALELVRKNPVDLVLLDVNLPLMDGFQTLVQLRQRHPSIPIIMISARQDKQDVIEGLKLGADDYVTKPFSIEEVVMRINTVLRRVHGESDGMVLRVGPVALSVDTYEAWLGEEKIDLSRTEFNLLRILMEGSNRVLTKDHLLREVWGYDFLTSTNVVDTYISYLRKKLHRHGFEGIKTVRGIGFQIKDS